MASTAGGWARWTVRARWTLPSLLAATMVAEAQLTATAAVLFPEAIALGLGVWVLRRPDWTVSRFRLATVPVACAVLGGIVTRLPGPRWLLAVVALCCATALLQAMSCRLGPALSAAVLPVVFDVRAWQYPVAVLVLCVVLAATAGGGPVRPSSPGRWDAAPLMTFLACACGWIVAAGLVGLPPVAAAPPLLVACLEFVLGGSGSARVAARRWVLLVTAAVAGAVAATWAPVPWWGALLAAAGVTLLMGLARDLHPPALAMSLVPFVVGPGANPLLVAGAVGTGAAVLLALPYAFRSVALVVAARQRGPEI